MPTAPIKRADLEALIAEELPIHWIIRNRNAGNMWMKAGQASVPCQGDHTLQLQNETIIKIVVGRMSKAELEGYAYGEGLRLEGRTPLSPSGLVFRLPNMSGFG